MLNAGAAGRLEQTNIDRLQKSHPKGDLAFNEWHNNIFLDCIVTLLHNFSFGNNLPMRFISSSWFLFFWPSGFGLWYLPHVFGDLKVLLCLWHLEIKHKLCQIMLLYCNSTMNLTGANKN